MKKYRELINAGEKGLSDNEYLEELILHIYRFRNDEICGVKDTNSTNLAITSYFSKMLGFKDPYALIGVTDDEIPCKVCEVADIFYQQDREVEQTKTPKLILDIHEYYTGFTPLKTTKSPIINPTTNNVLGTFYHASEFTINTTLKTILNLHGGKFGNQAGMMASNIEKDYSLTNREVEVLFCACLGFSDRKSIANFLSFIHKRDVKADTTVKDAFKGLYSKLPCNSIPGLLEFSVANNLHLQIPKSFLVLGSFELQPEIPIIK